MGKEDEAEKRTNGQKEEMRSCCAREEVQMEEAQVMASEDRDLADALEILWRKTKAARHFSADVTHAIYFNALWLRLFCR